jgi:hypothetical protein
MLRQELDEGASEAIAVDADGRSVIDRQYQRAQKFDAAFGPTADTEAVYNALGSRIVAGAVEGFNA